jgi:hypothetical protein
MPKQYVQFANALQEVVVSWFGRAQDPDEWIEQIENQGVVDDDDQRLVEFLRKSPSNADSVASREAVKVELLNSASISMNPYILAIQIGDASDSDIAMAKKWRDYFMAVKSVDVTGDSVEWPASVDSN